MSAIADWREVHASMKQVLSEFIPVVRSWTTEEDNRVLDPFETHYSENYAPGNAAVLLSSAYRNQGRAEDLEACLDMVRRSVELLKDREGVSPFCRVFLFHYSLMSLLLLPEEERERCRMEFEGFYAKYEDDCLQINTNCAALQWGMELFLDALGFREADAVKLESLLSMVEMAQLPSHFINDELTHERISLDGMPIAYHLFIVFILAGTLIAIERWKPVHAQFKARAESVIARGIDWMLPAMASDGTLAMTERSSHQMFTWGALTVLLSLTNLKNEPIFKKTWEYWLKFRKEDGSYSCTPNYLPHGLRVGFETYTHVNMYNNLGMTGIALAELWLARGGKFFTPKMGGYRIHEESRVLDFHSGFAFIKRPGQSFASTLRMHSWKYTPAMQGFHYRLDGYPLPLAEPRLPAYEARDQRFFADGVWEGVLLVDENGGYCFPDTAENVEAEVNATGISMHWQTEALDCRKEIVMLDRGFSWRYRLHLKRMIHSLQQRLPLLIHDGREGLRVREISRQQLVLSWAGQTYRLECGQASGIEIGLERSLLSASGVAASGIINIPIPSAIGTVIEWETRLIAD